MKRLDLTEAVQARVRVCQEAMTQGADEAVMGQVLSELGAEVLRVVADTRALRLTRLPPKAAPVPFVIELELRRKWRSPA